MYDSLKVKSTKNKFDSFTLDPKITLNQHLLKPTKPKKLATNNNKIQIAGAVSNNPE